MKSVSLCLLMAMLVAGMMADHRHAHDDTIIVVDEYPEGVVYEMRPGDRIRQWQAIFARGETGGADYRDQQKKRNVDVINSLLALPKGLNAAGRR